MVDDLVGRLIDTINRVVCGTNTMVNIFSATTAQNFADNAEGVTGNPQIYMFVAPCASQ